MRAFQFRELCTQRQFPIAQCSSSLQMQTEKKTDDVIGVELFPLVRGEPTTVQDGEDVVLIVLCGSSISAINSVWDRDYERLYLLPARCLTADDLKAWNRVADVDMTGPPLEGDWQWVRSVRDIAKHLKRIEYVELAGHKVVTVSECRFAHLTGTD